MACAALARNIGSPKSRFARMLSTSAGVDKLLKMTKSVSDAVAVGAQLGGVNHVAKEAKNVSSAIGTARSLTGMAGLVGGGLQRNVAAARKTFKFSKLVVCGDAGFMASRSTGDVLKSAESTFNTIVGRKEAALALAETGFSTVAGLADTVAFGVCSPAGLAASWSAKDLPVAKSIASQFSVVRAISHSSGLVSDVSSLALSAAIRRRVVAGEKDEAILGFHKKTFTKIIVEVALSVFNRLLSLACELFKILGLLKIPAVAVCNVAFGLVTSGLALRKVWKSTPQ